MSLPELSPSGEPAGAGSQPASLLLFAYQNVPPAPGREPSVAQPSTPATPPGAPPPAGPSGLGGMLPLLIMVVPMILLLFFSNRSQQKKQAAALASLKKGDRVLTDTGLAGRLVELGDRYAKLEIAPGVKVDVLRTRIAGADTPETQTAAAQSASEKK